MVLKTDFTIQYSFNNMWEPCIEIPHVYQQPQVAEIANITTFRLAI